MPNKLGFNGNFYYFYMCKINCKILDTWSIVSEYKENKKILKNRRRKEKILNKQKS